MDSTVTNVADFRRARSPEQKAMRRTAILAAARRLALANGVRNVSLGDIAKDVGLTKSNVLRYFDTREEIYLHLATTGYRDWCERAAGRVELPEEASTEWVAASLVDCLADDPLFCDLLANAPASLEHNVSRDSAMRFKYTLLEAVDDLATSLAQQCPGLSFEQGQRVVTGTMVLASGLWPWANPPTLLKALYLEEEELARRCRIDFRTELRRLTESLVAGIRAETVVPGS
ncbi:TetR family transcriptional regulator [Pseudonocardia eucalypti]|uniref:TetR family transcriptional regulator n=1 Tax=Pseudonocardia eucalypti TaxID=648755 RepID=A0ABP9QER1_9PSEU|nr:AcrR family transcriptional regulator [Pseudonocardia eucalypti]